MPFRRSALLVALVMLLASPAALPARVAAAQDDETFTHQAGGFQFDLPKGWKAAPDGDDMTLTAPAEAILVMLNVSDEATFEAAVNAIAAELDKMMKNVKVEGEMQFKTHNGMKLASLNGTGQLEGANVLWALDLLQAKRPVIVLSFATPEEFPKHVGEYKALVQSMRPLK